MKFWILLVAWFFTSFTASAADPVKLPAKDKFYLFLLVGQSNMAGRGLVEAQDQTINPRVLSLNKNGQWVPAVDPIHFDKTAAGVGLGRTFGMLAAEQFPDVTIGLIPCACGGSPIKSWVPGGYHDQTKSNPYDDAIARAKSALTAGTLKGILWHQGEADVSMPPEKYEEKMIELFTRFRTELKAPEVPVIIGQLGQFKPWTDGFKKLYQAQLSTIEKIGNAAIVSSDGLTCNPDIVHFNAASQREFGRRYFASWLKTIEKQNQK